MSGWGKQVEKNGQFSSQNYGISNNEKYYSSNTQSQIPSSGAQTQQVFGGAKTSFFDIAKTNTFSSSTTPTWQQPPTTPTWQQPSTQPSTWQQPSTQPSTWQQPSTQPSTWQQPSTQPSTWQQPSTQPSTWQQPSTQPSTWQQPQILNQQASVIENFSVQQHREIVSLTDRKTLYKLQKHVPNPVSPGGFTEASMEIIKHARKERNFKYNENLVTGFVESNIEYLPPIRCSCQRPVMIEKYDLFYELVDPEGPYKLSYNQAFDEVNVKNECCRLTFTAPPVISTESADYDIRYASGKINPERQLIDKESSIPSTIGNAMVSTFDTRLMRDALPQIQSSYERKNMTENKVEFNVDPESQIIIPPNTVRIATLNVGGEMKVPVFSKHVNLRALRKK